MKIEKPRLFAGFLVERWTRTQRIRTTAGIPVEAVIVDPVEVPVYLKIAEKARHLRELGMSDKAIAAALGVSDKTVAKAILDWRPTETHQSNTSSAEGGCHGGSYS